MSLGLIDAIGIFGTALGTVGFLKANLPASHPQGASVRIKAGLPDLTKESDSLGGNINHVYAFDERNGYAGQSDGCKLGSGGICDKTISQPEAGRRAKYISVSNNNDATCIAWITVTQYDGSQGGAWTGDIGASCGQSWYNSVESAGNTKTDKTGEDYKPKCTWLDGDHTNGIPSASLKFDVDAYGTSVNDTLQKDACTPTIFSKDNSPIAAQPAKRDGDTRPVWIQGHLIMSNFTSHPAAELCNSATSWGPDFVGSDGLFCDMGTHTLTPLCSTKNVEGCVEVDPHSRKLKKRKTVARRSINIDHKSYDKVSQWGS